MTHSTPDTERAPAPGHPTALYHQLDDGRVQCDVCPRACALQEGQRGLCFVRGREQDAIWLYTYGRSSGFAIDPIEKKPLNHFLPGTSVLSFGTAGCNLTCRFCQNWDMSKSREMDLLAAEATPEQIADTALKYDCHSVAYTYNDPVIFLEYACDTAHACRERGIRNVAVTAGYVSPGARETFFAEMDAANIDLKGFTDSFYKRLCSAGLSPVLETLEYLHQETNVWLELTTLLIPGENDSDAELTEMAAWVVEHLGPDVPMHFSAFHPAYKMVDVPRTPTATLTRARRIAREQGVRYAYTGNVHDGEGNSTWCHHCGHLLIERDWYQLGRWGLTAEGTCERCGAHCAGVFEAQPQAVASGARRVPVRPSAAGLR